MRDEGEGAAKSPAGPSGGGLGAAAALSLAGARGAEAYLEESTRLVRLQIEDLEEDRVFNRLGHFSTVMKVAFEGLMALILAFVAVAIGSAVWIASQDSSLVIEPFSVPADMQAQGLTGHVVAAQVQDRLASLQAQTNSMRAASSYQNNWGDGIQVQIPETGVSIGELNRYLHDWLGHQTHISGEIFRDGDRLTVTARIGSEPAQSVSGKPADLDALLRKAAEAVYGRTQPYRYAVYLMSRNRLKEAAAAYMALATSGSALDRSWAYIGLDNLAQLRGDIFGALGDVDRALAVRPDFALALINKDGIQSQLQQTEAAYRTELEIARVLHGGAEPDINPAAIVANRLSNDSSLAGDKGDFLAALRADAEIEARPDYSGSIAGARRSDAATYAFLHDRAGVRRALAALSPPVTANDRLNRDATFFLSSALVGDWQTALATAGRVVEAAAPLAAAVAPFLARGVSPLKAYAMAMTGDVAGARALIAKSPLDCDTCLRVRARIAMAGHDWKAAEHWASLCAARTPSLPQCVFDWGDVLRAKGDDDGAIAKYEIAHARGPHFADPLEGWGEALMAKNRSDLAVAKFEEAARYAPNWARLHLKWGEALLWSGHRDEARKQFAMASSLFLSPAEKAQLQRMKASHG